MFGETLIHLIPYLISILISTGVGLYAWRRQEVVGAQTFAVVSLVMAFWTLGYVFELFSPSLQAKIFWDNVQWVAFSIIPIGILAFALQYTGRKLAHPKRVWGILIAIPLVFLLLVFTDNLHQLVRPSAWLVPGEPFDALVYEFSFASWVMVIYFYSLTLSALVVLLLPFFRSKLYRAQVGVIIVGSALPLIIALLTLTGVIPTFQRDSTPFTFMIYNLLIAWGLFRYRLFDVVPVARDRVIENIPDAVIVLDARSRVVDLNPVARKFVEHSNQRAIGLPVAQVFPHWPSLEDYFLDNQETHAEISVKTDQDQYVYDLDISPLYNRRHHLTGRTIVVRDITRRKQVENELKQHRDHLEELVEVRTTELATANEQLRREIVEREKLEEQARQSQKMEAIGRLAGGIAHDFNNLLTVISGYSELLLNRHIDFEDPVRQSLEQIIAAADHAAALTQQLLAFSRTQVLQPKILNLNDVIVDMEKMLRRLIGEDIELVTLPNAKSGAVKVDLGQIQQVIMNLVINARDAMPQGGQLTIETSDFLMNESGVLQHIDIQPGAYVLFTVSDTGIGMDKRVRDHIFEPFFTTKNESRGTGLGLATVYGIVKQSEGTIYVYSEPEQGTSFKIYLPQIGRMSTSSVSEIEPLELQQGTETILLVEDDEGVRCLAYEMLIESGYTVLEAGRADEAEDICRNYEDTIHLLVTDIVMPGGRSGRELAEYLTGLFPTMQVLYMSGYTDDAIVRHGILEEEVAFLQKPFTFNMLIGKVREVLDSPN